jgi:hypothetical protein
MGASNTQHCLIVLLLGSSSFLLLLVVVVAVNKEDQRTTHTKTVLSLVEEFDCQIEKVNIGAKYFLDDLGYGLLVGKCTSCHTYFGTRKQRFVTLILGRRE